MEHQVKFTGNAKEYFGIWIVNILLSIVTLGIYSAWAKVRTNRYFYGNTSIDGHAFEYHATGKQILIGRVIVVGALVLFQIAANISPITALALLVPYILAVPYLIARGLRFSRRVSSYRNVRFDFNGGYLGALWAYIIFPLIPILILGPIFALVGYNSGFFESLKTPASQPKFTYLLWVVIILWGLAGIVWRAFTDKQLSQYVTNHTSYGDRPFKLSLPVTHLVIISFAMAVMPIVLLVIGYWIAFGWLGGDFLTNKSITKDLLNANSNSSIIILVAYILILILPAILGNFIYAAKYRNLVFSETLLDNKHGFRSTVSWWKLAFITITNILVVLVSLGLMSPWARIRLTRYLADNTTVEAAGSLDEYSSTVKAASGVVGDEFMDIEGFEIGAGL